MRCPGAYAGRRRIRRRTRTCATAHPTAAAAADGVSLLCARRACDVSSGELRWGGAGAEGEGGSSKDSG
eukprot:200216-Rhodomonas_salina.2